MKAEELERKAILLAEQEAFKKYLKNEIEEIVKSGYIDPSDEPDDSYGLAKVVLYCALKRLAGQYYPLSGYYRDRYKELLEAW